MSGNSQAEYIKIDNAVIEMAKGKGEFGLKDLPDLFAPDSIRDGSSLRTIKSLPRGMHSLADMVQSDVKLGLKDSTINDHIGRFGKNDPIIVPPKTLCKLICEALEDTMLRILCLAAVVSLAIGILKEGIAHGWMEGVTIWFAVFLVVSVGAGNNYVKEQQFAKLNAKREQRDVEIIRDGKPKTVNIYDLTPGDLMIFNVGEIFPVDGVLIRGSSIQVDESSVTGESDLLEKKSIFEMESAEHHESKKKYSPFLISGSRVMEGTGLFMIICVGRSTQAGKLKVMLMEETPATPLQIKLEQIANDIGKIGVVCASLTFLALMGHLVYMLIAGNISFLSVETLDIVVDSFIIGVTIIVVAVPEGLPLAVTIALAYSVGKMKDENNLVRQLSSCETMGGANNICSDKTGTLTQNRMKLVRIFIEMRSLRADTLNEEKLAQNSKEVLFEGICFNSTANPIFEQKGSTFTAQQVGNRTECALLEEAYNFGYNYLRVRDPERIAKAIPFSSKRKRMTTAVFMNADKSRVRVYSKGAPDFLLESCIRIVGTGDELVEMTRERNEEITNSVISVFAKDSLRTIALTYKDISVEEFNNSSEDDLERNLILLGIAGIKDPLRPDVPQAIQTCHKAGIHVRMVTGDNIFTATAIAKECGILPDIFDLNSQGENTYRVLEGKRFRELIKWKTTAEIEAKHEEEKKEQDSHDSGRKHPNIPSDISDPEDYQKDDDKSSKVVSRIGNKKKFKEIVDELVVLARSSPEDKFALVTGLIELGNVVAVTGDGTNDAPALKKADIGFAMGIAGTEIAKEAAGIILLDDNFSSILTACKFGRNVYDSIRKFLQFQLTVNVVALFMAFLGGAVLKETPINAIQMLWVNLIMDTFAALALATEPPSNELLERPPYGRNDYIITGPMWRNILGQALYQITVLTVLLFFGPMLFNVPSTVGMDRFDEERAVHFTLIFHTFVFMQVFNEINCRKLKANEFNVFKGFCNNWLFFFIEIITVLFQVLLVEYAGSFVKVSPLSLEQHLICAIIGMGSIIFGLAIKMIPDAAFNFIKLFREDEVKHWEIDRSLPSLLKRRASSRFRSQSFMMAHGSGNPESDFKRLDSIK